MAINVLKQSKTEIEKAAEDAKVRKVVEATLGEIEKNGATLIPVDSEHNAIFQVLDSNQIDNIEVLGPVDSPLLRIKKNFRSRLLIRFENQNLMQKKISKVLNGLKISSKIKLTVDVDPINFA